MNLNFTRKPKALQSRIDEALSELEGTKIDTNEYQKMLTVVERLYKLQENNTPARVSRDTLVTVAGNLAVVVLILGFEREHVLTTKAFAFLKTK